ncbi:MAG: hypothetical protein WAM09_04765 [Anaerolineales bacterium]
MAFTPVDGIHRLMVGNPQGGLGGLEFGRRKHSRLRAKRALRKLRRKRRFKHPLQVQWGAGK